MPDETSRPEYERIQAGDRLVIDLVRGQRVTWLSQSGDNLVIDAVDVRSVLFEIAGVTVPRYTVDLVVDWALDTIRKLDEKMAPRVAVWDGGTAGSVKVAVFSVDPIPVDPATLTRQDLIDLCTDGVVAQEHWSNRDTPSAQQQLGRARSLLAAGCDFLVRPAVEEGRSTTTDASDENTLWVWIRWHSFHCFEYGCVNFGGRGHPDAEDHCQDDTFYVPTRARIDRAGGKDWY